jgi:small subunit ribosomal protein S1
MAGIFFQKGIKGQQSGSVSEKVYITNSFNLPPFKYIKMATKTADKEAKTSNLMTMEELLAQEKPIAQLQRGDVVEGTVIDINHGEILVDVGAKAEGVIVSSEIREEKEMVADLKPGDGLLVYIVSTENEHGQIQLSLKKAALARKWISLKKAADDSEVLTVRVLEYNKGGLIVDYQKIRGFIPFSHLVSGPARTATPQEVTDELNNLISKELQVVIIEADQKTNRLILSEKKAHQDAEREKKTALMAKFNLGDVVMGTVTRVMPFGLLVDIGGFDALVHASEVSWDKSSDFTSDYQVGKEIQVKVVELDEQNGKVNLSIKQLSHDPWEDKSGFYKVGQAVEAVVTKITSYGTIVDIDQLTGLLRDSSGEFKVGDKLNAFVINVDKNSRRLDISLEEPKA